MTALLLRDLSIVWRARTTWWLGALASLAIGAGFIRALNQAHELGGTRGLEPMLRALYIVLCVFGPVVAARTLSREKERRTVHALLLQTGSVAQVVWSKWLTALVGVGLPWLLAAVLVQVWRALVGEQGVPQAMVTLLGYALYAGYVTWVGVAAAALTPSFRSAVPLGWLAIAWNAAIDLSGSVPALAFLESDRIWSPGTYLAPFERGELALGAALFIVTAGSTGFAMSWIGLRFDIRGRRRWVLFALATAVWAGLCLMAAEVPGSWDFAAS